MHANVQMPLFDAFAIHYPLAVEVHSLQYNDSAEGRSFSLVGNCSDFTDCRDASQMDAPVRSESCAIAGTPA